MASASASGVTSDSRVRATAIHHARSIEEKKQLQSRTADLVVEAFDLPSRSNADPAKPDLEDLRLFRTCLSLFQSSDLDDLIYERNIDDRCGYALCPRPNKKIRHNGEKIWNRKGGNAFKLVDKAELEKWCSRECAERVAFIRTQLSKEPAWLRGAHNQNVKLLDEVRRDGDLAQALKDLSISDFGNDGIGERLKALSLERGETELEDVSGQVSIMENETELGSSRPPGQLSNEVIEGHQPKQVKFAAGV